VGCCDADCRGSACDQAERMLGTSSIPCRPASHLALGSVPLSELTSDYCTRGQGAKQIEQYYLDCHRSVS
jgi:hypothetical protein